MAPEHTLLTFLLSLGRSARQCVLHALHHTPLAERIAVGKTAGSDLIYAIDQGVEHELETALEREAAGFGGFHVVAEGLGDHEEACFPTGRSEQDCAWHLLIDPIDGTRGIMYDKRSAWFLVGAAPNTGKAPELRDIELAVMVELPTSRAAVGDCLWAVRGQGCGGLTESVRDDLPLKPRAFQPAVSGHTSVRGGFASFVRFFPPGKPLLAHIEEEMLSNVFPDAADGEILSFEDQYISSGGQLYELVTGKDRFVADIRGALYRSAHFNDTARGHVCHPYDLAAHLIGEEAGCIITDVAGEPLDAPFDTTTAVDWLAYANKDIHRELEVALRKEMQAAGLV